MKGIIRKTKASLRASGGTSTQCLKQSYLNFLFFGNLARGFSGLDSSFQGHGRFFLIGRKLSELRVVVFERHGMKWTLW